MRNLNVVIGAAILLLVGMASCSKELPVDHLDAGSIQIAPKMNVASSSGLPSENIGFKAGDAIGLYCWTGGPASEDIDWIAQNETFTAQTKNDELNWTPSNNVEWRDNVEHYFAAIYPSPKSDVDITALPVNKNHALFIASNRDGLIFPNETPVSLNFKPIQAKIRFNFIFGNPDNVSIIKKVELTGCTSGYYNLLTDELVGREETIELQVEHQSSTVLMVPGQGFKLNLDLGADGKLTYNLPENIVIESGKFITLELQIGDGCISLFEISSEEWVGESIDKDILPEVLEPIVVDPVTHTITSKHAGCLTKSDIKQAVGNGDENTVLKLVGSFNADYGYSSVGDLNLIKDFVRTHALVVDMTDMELCNLDGKPFTEFPNGMFDFSEFDEDGGEYTMLKGLIFPKWAKVIGEYMSIAPSIESIVFKAPKMEFKDFSITITPKLKVLDFSQCTEVPILSSLPFYVSASSNQTLTIVTPKGQVDSWKVLEGWPTGNYGSTFKIEFAESYTPASVPMRFYPSLKNNFGESANDFSLFVSNRNPDQTIAKNYSFGPLTVTKNENVWSIDNDMYLYKNDPVDVIAYTPTNNYIRSDEFGRYFVHETYCYNQADLLFSCAKGVVPGSKDNSLPISITRDGKASFLFSHVMSLVTINYIFDKDSGFTEENILDNIVRFTMHDVRTLCRVYLDGDNIGKLVCDEKNAYSVHEDPISIKSDKDGNLVVTYGHIFIPGEPLIFDLHLRNLVYAWDGGDRRTVSGKHITLNLKINSSVTTKSTSSIVEDSFVVEEW